MLQLYGQDKGTGACHHASKYRYLKDHGMLTEVNCSYQHQRAIGLSRDIHINIILLAKGNLVIAPWKPDFDKINPFMYII
jgi:hypothetical protein